MELIGICDIKQPSFNTRKGQDFINIEIPYQSDPSPWKIIEKTPDGLRKISCV